MKKFGIAIAVLYAALCVGIALAEGETKYASGTTSAAVTFGPARGATAVQSVFATTDKEGAVVKFYGRSGNKKSPSAAQSAGGVQVSVASHSITNDDPVVIVHSNGTLDYRTVTNATTTYIQLSSATSAALTTAGKIYELSQQGEIVVGFDGTATGTNDTLAASGGVLFVTPGDSPLYCVLDGTATAKLQVTVDK